MSNFVRNLSRNTVALQVAKKLASCNCNLGTDYQKSYGGEGGERSTKKNHAREN